MDFKDALKYLRVDLGVTQMELANALRVNVTTVGRWEHGKTLPSRALAAATVEFALKRGASGESVSDIRSALKKAAKNRLVSQNGDRSGEAAELEEAERRTINATPCGIAVVEVDPNDMPGSVRTTYYNDRFYGYSGYEREEYDLLLKNNEMHFVFDEDVPVLLEATKRICESDGGEAVDAAVRCHVKDGGYRWLLLTGRLNHRRGGICVLNIVMVDITNRKLAEDRLRISDEILRIAAETDKRAIITYDIKRGACRVESRNLYSARFGEIIEGAPDSLIERGIVSPESAENITDMFNRIRAGESDVSASLSLRTSENEYQWFECNAGAVNDSDGAPDQAVLVFHNVTEQRVKEAIFKKWQNSIKSRPIGSYTLFRTGLGSDLRVYSREGRLIKIEIKNDARPFREYMRDYAEASVFDDDRQKFSAMLDPDATLAAYYRGEHMNTLEYREKLKNGDEAWRRLTVETVEYIDSSDIQAFWLFEDIDEFKKEQIRDKELAETDPLTGALNRMAFSEQVDILLKNEANTQHALMMLDMDGFKLLNDKFGHAAGDQALQDIAAVLRSLIRDGDLVCRLGGDEFLMWLRGIPYDAVIEKIAQHVCDHAMKAFSQDVQLSASVGVSVYPRDGHDFDELYRNADKALYRVKQAGKNGFALFSPTQDALAEGSPDKDGESESGSAVKTPAKRRMLIIDSSDESRNALKTYFRDDYRIEAARTGSEALIRLRHFGSAISIVLLSLNISGMDGFEVLKRIQDNVELRTIPVIAVSDRDDHALLLKAIELGASDYVTKPIDAELIRMRVASAVSKAENERLRAQNSYLQLQRDEDMKFHTVLESTGTVVVEYDWRNHVFIYDNMIANYIAGRFDHRGLWQILLSDMVADSEDVKALQDMLFKLGSNRGETNANKLVKLKTPNNARHWFRVNIYKREDFYGLAEKMIITFNDVHEEVLSNEKLQYQASHDELTGLYSRAGFIQKAAELIARKETGYYVLSCVDIEKFKVINDQYGSVVGDDVLRGFADALTWLSEKSESVCCRVMADNFAVLYPKRLIDSPEMTALHRRLEQPSTMLPHLKIYVGRCVVDDKALGISAIYDRAVMAKETVKGRYDAYIATYDESMRTSLLRRQYITGQMKNALESGQFEVWLQPQFNHATGRLTGAEALARWRHPVEGIISPSEFIPIFEQNGFVYEVDKFVWEETCKLLRKWIDADLHPVPVSVNVSRCDVFKPDLIDTVKGLVEKYSLPNDLLRLEITESAFSESNEIIINVVKEFVALGFVVEIDDFGSGYSSLNTLKDVPAQVLKMDMRFLENDENAQRGGSIIESVVRMARWLGMSVIAEGVETLEQADYLKSIGCEHVQGYLYSRPARSEEYESMFASGFVDSEPRKPEALDTWNNNAFWNPSSIETLIFNSYVGGACIFEFRGGKTELLRYNDGYAEVFGYGAVHGQMLNRSDILEALDAENAAIVRENIENAIRTGKESACECSLEKTDMSCTYARVTVRLIARAGDRSLLYCVVTDITAQRAAERAEREIASRNAVIMDNMAGGITAVCIQGGRPRMIFSNDRYYAQLGYTREQFERETKVYFEAIHPEDRNAVWNKVNETLKSGKPRSMEYRCIKRDGKIVHIRSNIALCRLDGVDSDVMITVETDISELVEANEHIIRTSERLKAVMDNATCGITAVIMHKDKTVEYLFVNDRYYDLVGYTRDEYLAAGFKGLELMHPDDLKQYENSIADLKNVGQSMSFEFRVVSRDGRTVWLRDDITVITLDGVDSPVQLSCFTDITQRRQADDRLRFVNELANEILSNTDAESAIDKSLRRLMEYCEAERCYIVELDFQNFVSNNTYEVCASGVASEKDRQQNLPFTENDYWYKPLKNHEFFTVDDSNALEDESLKELLKSQGIRSMILAPLWRDGRLTGFAGVDNPSSVPDKIRHFTAPADYISMLLTRRDIKRAVGHDITPDDGLFPAASYIRDMLPVVFSTMMDTSDDISFIKDRNDRYAAVSAAAVKAFGLNSAADIIGKTAKDVFGLETVGRFMSEDKRIFETGKSVIDREVMLPLRTNGGKAVFRTSKYPLLDASGDVIGIYCVCRNVTSEKVTEFELNTLLRVIPSGVLKYSADEKEEFAYVNRNFTESLGYTEEEFRKKFNNCFREMVWKEDRERAEYEIATQESDGGIGRFDYRIEAADGQLHWFHDEGVKITDDYGKEWYYVTLVDITRSKKNEANLRLAEEEYRLATRHSGHTIGRYDVENETLTITEDAATRLALPETITDVPYGRVRLGKISSDTKDAYIRFYENIKNGGREGSVTFKKLLSDGWRWITERSTTIFDENGKPVSAIISYSDVTEQQEKELVYKRWQQSMEGKDPSSYTLFRCNLSKNTPPDTWEGELLDSETAKTFDARTQKYSDALVFEADREKYSAFLNTDTMLAEYYRGRRAGEIEYREITPDGVRWLKLTIDMVEAPGSSDVEAYLLYENIDEKKRAELEAKHSAETDPLTGLLNRKAFAERVNDIIQKSGDTSRHAFIMLDIDDFKSINDTFGHAEGDSALIYTAEKLSSLMRKGDLLGRLGGDEFVMFLSGVSGELDMGKKAEQICESLVKTYPNGSRLSVSIGVSFYPKDGTDSHTLYEHADAALYKAKGCGRNTYKLY